MHKEEEGNITMAWAPGTDFRKIVDECMANSEHLNPWERETFLPSIDEQMDRNGGKLSERQADLLETIYLKLP